MSPVRTSLSRVLLASLALTSCGGDEAPAPFPADVRRGVVGSYRLTGGDWSYSRPAYSYRYQHAWARLSVFDAPAVTCDAVRITQPPGQGPPFAGLENRFAATEIELYLGDDPSGEAPGDPDRNILTSERLADTSADGSVSPDRGPENAVDGRVASDAAGPRWESPSTPTAHWIAFTFREPVTWSRLVVYWPWVHVPSAWHPDRTRTVVDGLRASTLIVEARIDGEWRRVEVTERRPASRFDGRFIQERLGLDVRPTARLSHLDHHARWREDIRPDSAAAPSGLDCIVARDWRIVLPPSAGALERLAARELRDTLERLGVPGLPIDALEKGAGPGDVGSKRIVIGTVAHVNALVPTIPVAGADSLLNACDTAEAHTVIVEPTRVWALGADAMGARYAACRLEERLRSRGGPFVRIGGETRRPAFRPRAAAGIAFGEGGPDELGFPDAYLSLFAHHYLDAVLIFQNGFYLSSPGAVVGSSLDPALGADDAKIAQLNGLVRRAAAHGLGVYWMVSVPGALPADVYERHPDLRGRNPQPHVICLGTDAGREYVRDTITRVARALPGLRGLVVLRSELSHTCGGRLLCPGCRDRFEPDEDPAQRLFDWVAEAAATENPALEVIAFDWRAGGLPAVDETRLPPGIAFWTRPQTSGPTPENDLQSIEPSPAFLRTIETMEPSRRLWIEGQLSHAFPLHTIPELPVPSTYWRKWTRVRARVAERAPGAPLPAFAMGNGSGLAPFPMVRLGLGTLLWDPLPPRRDALAALATDTFGARAVDAVLDAWRHFDDALARYTRIDKYVTRATLIDPPGTGRLLASDDLVVALDGLCAEWASGAVRLHDALEVTPAVRLDRARAHVAMADAALSTLRSWRHAVTWAHEIGDTWVDGAPPSSATAERVPDRHVDLARRLLDEEIANTEAYVAIISRDGVFRSHPYYRDWFTLDVIVEKLQRMREVRDALARREVTG